MPTPLIECPGLILEFEVKRYTQKQGFVTNPDRLRGFQLGSKVTGLFLRTILHVRVSSKGAITHVVVL